MNTEEITPRTRQRDIREKRIKYFSKQLPESTPQQRNVKSKPVKDTRQVFQPPEKKQSKYNKIASGKHQKPDYNSFQRNQKPAYQSKSLHNDNNSRKHGGKQSDWSEDTSLEFENPELFDNSINDDDLYTHRPELDTSRTTELLIESCRNYKEILQEREQEKSSKYSGGDNGSKTAIVHGNDFVFDYETARQKLQKSRLRVAEIEKTLQCDDEEEESSSSDTNLSPIRKERAFNQLIDEHPTSFNCNGAAVKFALTSDQIYEMAKLVPNSNHPPLTDDPPRVAQSIADHFDFVKQFGKDVRRSSEIIKKNNHDMELVLSHRANDSNSEVPCNEPRNIQPESQDHQHCQEDTNSETFRYDNTSNIESCLSLGILDEHLKRIGVDPNVIRWASRSQASIDINPLGDLSIEYFRRCPDCHSRNKTSVTWCLNCGCVLIGIEPEAAPKSSKRSSNESRPIIKESIETRSKGEQSVRFDVPNCKPSRSVDSNYNNSRSAEYATELSNYFTPNDIEDVMKANITAKSRDANGEIQVVDIEENSQFHAINDDVISSDEENLSEQLKLTLNDSIDIVDSTESSIPFDIPVLDEADYREICSSNAQNSKHFVVPPLQLDATPRNSLTECNGDSSNEFASGILSQSYECSSTKRSDAGFSINSSNRFYDKRMTELNTNNSAGCNKTTDTSADLSDRLGAIGGQDDPGCGDSNQGSARKKKNFQSNRKRNDSDRTYQRDRFRYNDRNRNQSENSGTAGESNSSQRRRGGPVSQRRWSSSSHQWSDHHPSVLQKKPSDYLRHSYNRKNSAIDTSSVRTLNADSEYVSKCLSEKNDSTTSDFDNESLSSRLTYGYFGSFEKYDVDELSLTPRALARLNLYTKEEIVSPCQDISKSTQEILKPRGWQEGDSPWLYLPDEIWLRIFKKLPLDSLANVSACCSTLHRIAQDSSLWRTIHLLRQHNLSNNHMASIGKRKPSILSLQNCHGDNITLLGLKNMFLECADSLRKLSFVSCSKGAFQGDQLLLLSAVYCQNLREVDASYAQNVRDTTVASLAEASLCLEKLHLNGAQNITDEGISALVNYHKDSLLSLELYGCFNLTSNSLRSISNCSKLQALSLGSLTKLSGTSITEMVSKLSCLSTLDLRGAGKHVVDATICNMATKCENMETLVLANIDRVTDRGIEAVAQGMPKLKSLDLCGCTQVGNKAVEALAKKCNNIKELDLSSTKADERGVVFLATYSKNSLRCLRMNFCKNIGKESLQKLVTNCKNLESIFLYGNNQIRNTKSLTDINDKLIVKKDD